MSAGCIAEYDTFANLTAFQRDLLWALSHENSCEGKALEANLNNHYNEELNHSRLNQNLDELVDLGLVTKQAHSKRTNEYSLTEEARRALSARQAWQAGHRDHSATGGHN